MHRIQCRCCAWVNWRLQICFNITVLPGKIMGRKVQRSSGHLSSVKFNSSQPIPMLKGSHGPSLNHFAGYCCYFSWQCFQQIESFSQNPTEKTYCRQLKLHFYYGLPIFTHASTVRTSASIGKHNDKCGHWIGRGWRRSFLPTSLMDKPLDQRFPNWGAPPRGCDKEGK